MPFTTIATRPMPAQRRRCAQRGFAADASPISPQPAVLSSPRATPSAQRYARYKNALPKAQLDVLDGANERSTEHENRRVHRQGVGNSGGPIRI
jgi:hypothetical protein